MTQIGAVPSMTADEATSVSASAYSPARLLRDATRASSRSVGAPRQRRALEAASKNASLTRPRSVTPGWATRAHSEAAPGHRLGEGGGDAQPLVARGGRVEPGLGGDVAQLVETLGQARPVGAHRSELVGRLMRHSGGARGEGAAGVLGGLVRGGWGRRGHGVGPEAEHPTARGLPELLLGGRRRAR